MSSGGMKMKTIQKILSLILVLLVMVSCSPKSDLQKSIDETFDIVSVNVPFDKEKTISVSILDLKDDFVYYTDFTGGSFPSGVFENKIYRMNIDTKEVDELFETSATESLYSLAVSKTGIYYIIYEPDKFGGDIMYRVYHFDHKEHELIGNGEFQSLYYGPELKLYKEDVILMNYGSFVSNYFPEIKDESVSILNLDRKEMLVQVENVLSNFMPQEEKDSGSYGLYSSDNAKSLIFSSNYVKDDHYVSDLYVYTDDELNTYSIKDHFTFNFMNVEGSLVFGASNENLETNLGITNYKNSNYIGSHNYSFSEIIPYQNEEYKGTLVSIRADYQLIIDGVEKDEIKYGLMFIEEGNPVFEELNLFSQKSSVITLVNQVISLDDNMDNDYVTIQYLKEK